jgi:hypothetical protein
MGKKFNTGRKGAKDAKTRKGNSSKPPSTLHFGMGRNPRIPMCPALGDIQHPELPEST